jgi:hypothetical protein
VKTIDTWPHSLRVIPGSEESRAWFFQPDSSLRSE